MNPIVVEFQDVTKVFGNSKANDQLSFKIIRNSIHALVGENGAGKSTAMKILFGLVSADSGKILIDGKPERIHSTLRARALGLGMVHQHFVLATEHSALENVLFSETVSPFQILNRTQKKIEYQKLAEQYGFQIPWDKSVAELSVGEQQRVEILKVLQQKARLLILDEPTAVLTPQEVLGFFKNLQELKNQGCTIVLITHKLKEVLAICDTVTVIRQGHAVQTLAVADTNQDQLAEMMVGRRIQWSRRELSPGTSVSKQNEPILKIPAHQPLAFQVNAGEVVGIAGVEGNGQAELIEVILNIKKAQASKIHMGVFPEDRLRVGSVPKASVMENFILGFDSDPAFCNYGWLRWNEVKKSTVESLQKYDVRPVSPELPFEQFSGGNQQKIIVARELCRNPEFILAAQPTRGVDVGAVEFIHEELLRAQERGAGILLISFDLDELLKLSTRILVLFNKKFVLELDRENFNELELGRAMGSGART
ncbi:MAG: ABC transporter ATP-binding protein [Bdellovibrionaceae bacterium]|nr:ABC transporter ATP-binding protein [Pseudobdellovibrionaceae bacterium]